MMEIPLCYIVLVMVVILENEAAAKCSQISPCTPLKGGDLFRKPSEQKSSDGSMQTNLSVGISEFTVDWLTTSRRLYNGEFPGPTFYWKAGDNIRVSLINNLEDPDFVGEINSLRLPNTTNLHTHGLHISSKEPQDNVLVKVGPGQTYNYQYEIHPQQPAGTYFYHGHNHGSAAFQALSGMSGMLIIEDDPLTMTPELDAVSCPNNCDKDIPIVFQTFEYRKDKFGTFPVVQKHINDNKAFWLNNIWLNKTQTLQDWLEDPVNEIQYILVNGQLNPVIEMKPGEMKRLRLLNAGGWYALALSISSNGSSSCTVHEISLDGHYLDQPRLLQSRSLLVAAGRVDWLVTCSQPAEYRLESSFSIEDKMSIGVHPSYNGNLLTFRVDGTAHDPPASFPTKLPTRPSFEQDLRNIKECDLGGQFVVETSASAVLNREHFVENSIRYKAEVGTVQEWYLLNTEVYFSHAIHLHVNSFQVISYNKYTGPYSVGVHLRNWKLYSQSGETCKWQHNNYDANFTSPVPNDALKYLGHDVRQQNEGGLGYEQIGVWRDTILVPPLSNITIRFNTDNFTGIVFVHCHMLIDADFGLTMLTEIVDKGSELTANITSGGAYPSSCMKNEPLYSPQCGGSSITQVSSIVLVTHLLIHAFIVRISFSRLPI